MSSRTGERLSVKHVAKVRGSAQLMSRPCAPCGGMRRSACNVPCVLILARLQEVLKDLRAWCSLAIMTDAAHLLSDVSGFGVAVFAGFYAAKKSQSTHTFGYVWPQSVLIAVCSKCFLLQYLRCPCNGTALYCAQESVITTAVAH